MSDAPLPSPSDDPAAFVAKWRGAWPEWSLVEGFVPAAERPLAEAWESLQFELQEAAWGGSDARPGEAKLGWWIEELGGWSQGRRRHPLGAELHRRSAPWRELAAAVPALAATRGHPDDFARAWSSMEAVADATAAVERALLGGTSEAAAVTAAWLHARLARHPGTVPAGATGADAWGRMLVERWPAWRGVTRSRAIGLALARARLARGDASAPLPPWSALWAGWRGARG